MREFGRGALNTTGGGRGGDAPRKGRNQQLCPTGRHTTLGPAGHKQHNLQNTKRIFQQLRKPQTLNPKPLCNNLGTPPPLITGCINVSATLSEVCRAILRPGSKH